jgi:hypothetical protein
MTRRHLFKAALFLLAGWGGMLALSLMLGREYGELLLPLYRWELGWLAPELRTLLLEVKDLNQQAVFAWSSQTRVIQDVHGRLLPANLALNSSTLLGHAIQHPFLIFPVFMAWPGLSLRRRLVLFVWGIPWLLLVEMLDVPIVLYGSIQDLILANLAPSMLTHSFPVQWMHVMNTGGRLALSLVAALLAIASLQLITARLRAKSPDQ